MLPELTGPGFKESTCSFNHDKPLYDISINRTHQSTGKKLLFHFELFSTMQNLATLFKCLESKHCECLSFSKIRSVTWQNLSPNKKSKTNKMKRKKIKKKGIYNESTFRERNERLKSLMQNRKNPIKFKKLFEKCPICDWTTSLSDFEHNIAAQEHLLRSHPGFCIECKV